MQQKPKARVTRDGGRYFIESQAVPILRRTPGIVWAQGRRRWEVLPTPLSVFRVYEAFDLRTVPASNYEWINWHRMHRHGIELWDGVKAETDAYDGQYMKDYLGSATEPWIHQIKAMYWLAMMLKPPSSGTMLYMGMGTGKTRVVLDFIRFTNVVFEGIRNVIVSAPLAVLPAWKRQVELHYPDKFRVLVLNKGSTASKAEQAERILKHDSGVPNVVVINHDAVWRPDFARVVRSIQPDLIVADESHGLKGRSTQRSKFFRSLAKMPGFRVCLTGTPLSNGALTDAFGQFCFMDPGMFGTSITRFEAAYAFKGNVDWVLSWRNEDHFYKRFWKLVHHEDRSVLDLPPAIHEERVYTLKGGARKAYMEMRDEFVAEIESGVYVTAANAAVKVNKLQQITSGFLLHERDDGTRETELLHSDKLSLLVDVLRETGDEPVVVFCRYIQDLRFVHEAAKRAGLESRELSGSRKELEEWQAGDGTVLAVQIQAGSLGIDLTRAPVAVFFSCGYSLGDYEQACDRLHRPGQEADSVVFIHLIAEDSIDRVVYRAIRKKQDIVEAVLAAKDEI